MVRGLSFIIPQNITNTLWQILNSIDVSKYSWYCVNNQTEVWDDVLGNDFFHKEYYSGDEFLKQIQKKQRIIFLKLQAHSSSHSIQNIHSYNEFVESDCELILLVNDCEYVEIYIKEHLNVDLIYKQIKRLGYNDVNYITEHNDNRKKMDVL